MTYQPLHHKYRPQTFADLVGQEAIATTLTNALRQQRIAPAYLFTGARGTGKTSSARILAKSLNCLQSEVPTEQPCGVCEVCQAIANGSALDVIEIDAASNTGVDNIRELIERSQFAPVQCRYKVYVVDECHMLSTAAFNALLKTLEEPPDRVVFVLATTDPQRVLPTIISRCQRFDFRRIPLAAMVPHLGMIADKEQIAITDDAVTLVAQISQGGLRDAESLLDQLSLLTGDVTTERVWDLVGAVPEQDLLGLLESIAQSNPEALLDRARRLMDRGREPLIVLQNLAGFYRDLLIAKAAPDRNDLVAITPTTWASLCELAQTWETSTILAGQQHLRNAEGQLKNTTQPRLWLEVTLMGLLPQLVAQTIPREFAASPSKPTLERSTVETINVVEASPPAQTPLPSPNLIESTPSSPDVSAQRVDTAGSVDLPLASEVEKPPLEIESPDLATASPPEPSPALTAATNQLSEIWQQIIAHLHPLSKALLAQHGQLLSFNAQEARIGISSDKLVKIAQGQTKNIEKAFVEVFNQKVTIRLEVVTIDPKGAREDVAPPLLPVSAAEFDAEVRGPQGRETALPNAPSPTSQEASADRAQPNPVEAPRVKSLSPTTAANPTSKTSKAASTDGTPTPISSWQEDEATRAAHQFAEFFNGRVVELTDEDQASSDSDPSPVQNSPENLPLSYWGDLGSEISSEEDVPF